MPKIDVSEGLGNVIESEEREDGFHYSSFWVWGGSHELWPPPLLSSCPKTIYLLDLENATNFLDKK